MKKKKQSFLIKGLYGHPQTHGYFTVKEYMMLEREGKHCLLIRFENEMKSTISELSFTVKQINATGKVIGRINLHYSDLRILPGQRYCTERGIVLNEECVDCIIQVKYLISSNVKYVFKRGMVTGHYDPRGYEKTEKKRTRKSYLSVRSRYMGGGKYYGWIAFLSFVLMLVFVCLVIVQSQDTYGVQALVRDCGRITGTL